MTKINPVLCVMCPREIPQTLSTFKSIDYVDKVYFKFMDIVQVHEEIAKFFNEHQEYTHLILISDDAIVKREHVAMLIADDEKYDFPSISGVCTNDILSGDMFLNVTLESDPVIKEIGESVTRESYKCLPNEFKDLNGIIKIWFEGNNFHMIRRDVFEKIGLTFEPNNPPKNCYSKAGDLTLSYHILKEYPQYADTRVYLEHFRYPLNVDPYRLLIGVKPPEIVFEKATSKRIPKVKPAEIINDIPYNFKRLMNFYYGEQKEFNICIVTEFEQENFFQWTMALNKVNNTPKRYGGWFTCSKQAGHKINLSSVVVNKPIETISKDKLKRITNADYVFVYTVRRNDKSYWYKLPSLVKPYMKPTAKMICQFDDEFTFLKMNFWKNVEVNDEEAFFKESKVLEIADIYLSVFRNPFWKKYCNKPVYYLPLPQLFRYDTLITLPKIKTTMSTHTGRLSGASFKEREKNIATMIHSLEESNIDDSLKLMNEFNVPSIVFSAKHISNIPINVKYYAKDTRKALMTNLRNVYIALDDNDGYIGWSRFAMECALACVPCLGSTEAIKDFFPDLYTEPKDYVKQRELINKLFTDEQFYESQKACGWIRVMTKLSDENLVTNFLKVLYMESQKEMDKILIATTFCNEDHSIDTYVDSLLKIDYPKELIDIVWIENNSSDKTWESLQQKYEYIKTNFNYKSITLMQKPCEFYGALKKPTIGNMIDGKTVFEPTGDQTAIQIRDHRNDHMIGLWNYMLSLMTDEHDYLLFYFADMIVPENILKKYISDLKRHPECGWIGGVHHYRCPRHLRNNAKSLPNYFGLESPTLQLKDASEVPPNYLKKWIYIGEKYGYPYNFAGATEEEIKRRQTIDDGVFPVCCTGHVWLMPRNVVKEGFIFEMGEVEAGLMAERRLNRMGYTLCCDANIYMKHISVDGKVYREDLDKFKGVESTEQSYIEFLRTLKIPVVNKPIQGTVWDGNLNRIIDVKDWEENYSMYAKFIDDKVNSKRYWQLSRKPIK